VVKAGSRLGALRTLWRQEQVPAQVCHCSAGGPGASSSLLQTSAAISGVVDPGNLFWLLLTPRSERLFVYLPRETVLDWTFFDPRWGGSSSWGCFPNGEGIGLHQYLQATAFSFALKLPPNLSFFIGRI